MKGTVASIRQAQQLREVLAPIRPRLDEVELFFSREFSRSLPMVRELAGYVLGSGGKRLRPALVLLISKMLGYTGERDVRYAAVVEMIHTATLIHDDIIDESELRRGRPTANKRWGNQGTVLVGDWLYTRAMDLCLEFGDVQVMRTLLSATLEMTEGEILADQVRGSVELREDRYMDITRKKTAELFAAACAIPALFQPSTLHLSDPLVSFGRNLGLCFQLVDDLLDFTADEKRLGKPVMADLCEGRITLPVIFLMQRNGEPARSLVAEVAERGSFLPGQAELLLSMVRSAGLLDEVRQRARQFSAAAVTAAAAFPEGPEKQSLIAAAGLLLDRDH